MNNFTKRSLSGLLFVVILTGCIFLHPVAFFVLFFLINILGLLEFSNMVKKLNVSINVPIYLICGCVLFTAGFLHTYLKQWDVFLVFFVATFILCIWELYRHKGNAFQNLAFSIYGLVYVSLPLTLLIYIPYMMNDTWRPEIIFFPFLLVWINDTFAYLFGVSLGRHKLFPRISPKKSWEGAIGGGAVTVATALILSPYIEGLTFVDNIVISLIVVIFGIFGDLLESMFKRSIEIKDSGDIMPGHGGVLDRFDSILFVIPAIFVYMEFVY
ncbi:phosphatidate cytidylyltransferase [Odoribacter sp. OttesenSCG-928-G04]|nr:phosphatidate cytidylyltransferase [Odoribacter sp. OttesenSCG-928-G04]